MPFAPDYVRLVLSEIFDDAVSGFLEPLMAIHEAHLVMLAETGIIRPEAAARLAEGLSQLDLWGSFERRHRRTKHPTREDRILDLAKGLQARFEPE
jgi:argininosuccinate lyase